jgi:hypothetical protein
MHPQLSTIAALKKKEKKSCHTYFGAIFKVGIKPIPQSKAQCEITI